MTHSDVHSNIVIFDFSRAQRREKHCKERHNTMENFVGGMIWFAKYSPEPKDFDECHVLAFSNTHQTRPIGDMGLTDLSVIMVRIAISSG